jgi:HD superfamily phosphohydrolase
MASDPARIMDALYGEIEVPAEINDLLGCPLVQRLRRIRQSNIDSLSMPGIANISRYEHSIGVAYLASRIGFRNRISNADRLIIQAAGLIHDTAITPFGHLAEEALHYIGSSYKHEKQWDTLFGSNDEDELGGVDLQLYLGHESGLRRWAHRAFGIEAETALQEIFGAIIGKGRFGKCISGEVDLDNLDNVVRIAYHMGLDVDRQLPLKIAERVIDSNETEGAIFTDDAIDHIVAWLAIRETVYNHLMLSRDDFCGKAMLLFAIVLAFKKDHLAPSDWKITDDDLIGCLLATGDEEITSTVKRWLLRDLWALSDLFWLEGDAPNYTDIYSFSNSLSKELGRPCFAYRIKDKRTRAVPLVLASGRHVELGRCPKTWLLGIASPLKKSFTSEDNHVLVKLASSYFSTRFMGKPASQEANQSLFEIA